MRRFISPVIAGTVLGGLLAATTASVAHAEASNTALATALDVPSGITVTQAGDARAFEVENRAFNDFPSRFGNGHYAVMSTGKASDLFNLSVPGGQPSTNLSGDDRASMTLSVGAEAAASGSCLLVDVAMGTEERVHTYDPKATASDLISLKRSGDDTEFALHAGPRYIGQEGARPDDGSKVEPTAMSVNAIEYWHGIDEEFDRQPDDQNAPLLAPVTPFDFFSSVETFEVPVSAGDTVTLSIADANNESLDSLAMVDHVRMAPSCSTSTSAETGLFPLKPVIVVGHRGVQNILTADLKPDTPQIERYDAADNGWYPSGVHLRFRWYKYWTQSTSCNDGDLKHWEAINNADRQSFSPTIDEKGRCLMVMVTGRKDGFRSETFPSPNTAAWTPTLPIQDGVFTNVDAPTISSGDSAGAIRVNDTLSATSGEFTPRPDSYVFQWYADGVPISGESGRTFKVTPVQAGKRISVRVTASRLNFSNLPVMSAPTETVDLLQLTATPTPEVTGTGRALDELVAVPGTWQPAPVSLTYQWYVDNTQITGATAPTYKPTAAQVGKRVAVRVTGRRDGYQVVTRESAARTITLRAFLQAPIPTITGDGFVGDQLTADPGVWDPAVSPTYQWYADGKRIENATTRAYRPNEQQEGQRIHVVTTGASSGYETVSRQSDPVVVRLRELVGPVPQIVNDSLIGGSVEAFAGTWTPSNAFLRYQWFADGKPLSNASSKSLFLSENLRGKSITVEVTGSLLNYRTQVRKSAPVIVRAHGFLTRAPRVTGRLQVGGAVMAQPGGWLPSPTTTSYEWYAGTRLLGRGTYLNVPPAAAGKRLRLVMTGSRLYYDTASASVTTGVVAAGAISSNVPSISGTARPKKVLRASPGYWGPAPVRYTYRWYVGSKAIKGATKSSYKVPKKYRGKKIRVRVTGTKSGYKTVARYSKYKKIAKK
ncbi:hypothetical protein H9L21_12060 [Aeromicrobium senzhongii]|uniref:Ig-like domain-containing protein n=1 Tax=Aeromicrobium senzhongii TaxID=2663859 RepID=A0ABX6SR27_9ACTN|nr:hypothetical protein [Aeromicrobium senzhongii]MTB88888.1 hypothetical protein [Aeromicrobium senzhongii]QNL93829.1 hypothetical protein H9L21_12060 [Aeromicrobium senzhongii]